MSCSKNYFNAYFNILFCFGVFYNCILNIFIYHNIVVNIFGDKIYFKYYIALLDDNKKKEFFKLV